jgi:hypothetical protein
MTKRLLNIGLGSCLLIIFLQIFAGFYELMQLKVLYLQYYFNGLNSFLNILVLIILWRVLAKDYKQSQLDCILKVMIGISTMTTLLLFLGFLHLERLVTITIVVLSVINLIFYFIFINRLMEIEKSEINQIEQLKNYSVAFVICLFGQFILSGIIEFNRIKGLDYISHLLILIPIIFIGLFFMKTKDEIKQR